MGVEEAYLNIIKAIYEKPTENILNGQKLEAFPLRSGTRQGWPVSPLLFNIVLEVLATPFRQERELKGNQIGKEEVKLSSFVDDMIVYIENPIDFTKKPLNLMSKFGKEQDKSQHLDITGIFVHQQQNIRNRNQEKILFAIATRKIKYLGINLTKEVKHL